jgi:hypothetical protein
MSNEPMLAYAPPPKPANTPADITRRALLWTLLCGISAAPSFIWAARGFNRLAMILGVVIFITLYTLTTSTPAFLRFREKPFIRRTLYIGYGTRILISVIFPVGMAADLIPGLISISVVHTILGSMSEGFVATLLITIVHGTILNFLLTIYMFIVWGFQRLFMKPPEEPRGFPILMNQPENPVNP